MTEAQRRYTQARDRVVATHLDPIRELMEATRELIAEANRERDDALDRYNVLDKELRPVWAQGWTNESTAAQASAGALAELWQMLGAQNQTEAVERLQGLIDFHKGGDR